MCADPKITLAPGFGPAAGFIRQARILLEHQLRQDKAFGHPVSAQRYWIPPDVTCVVLHEYERTYLSLSRALHLSREAPTQKRFSPIFMGVKFPLLGQASSVYYSLNGLLWEQTTTPVADQIELWAAADRGRIAFITKARDGAWRLLLANVYAQFAPFASFAFPAGVTQVYQVAYVGTGQFLVLYAQGTLQVVAYVDTSGNFNVVNTTNLGYTPMSTFGYSIGRGGVPYIPIVSGTTVRMGNAQNGGALCQVGIPIYVGTPMSLTGAALITGYNGDVGAVFYFAAVGYNVVCTVISLGGSMYSVGSSVQITPAPDAVDTATADWTDGTWFYLLGSSGKVYWFSMHTLSVLRTPVIPPKLGLTLAQAVVPNPQGGFYVPPLQMTIRPGAQALDMHTAPLPATQTESIYGYPLYAGPNACAFLGGNSVGAGTAPWLNLYN